MQAQVSAAVTSTTNNGKNLAVSKGQTTQTTQQAPATALIGGKPIMPTQTNIAAQPLVLSKRMSSLIAPSEICLLIS